MMIKTTHVGSLPRPQEMNTKNLKNQPITDEELTGYVRDILDKQIAMGITYVNNGELPRTDYINATIKRISGFFETGIAPIPKDLEELPEFSRRFGGRNGLITLNPKAPISLPACSGELSYRGETSLRKELTMMTEAFKTIKETHPESQSELFFTAPSPGTVALFMENKFYPDYETYLEHLAKVLKQEYDVIRSYGVYLQIDCPDLAMGRHTRFRHLPDDRFLAIMDTNIQALKLALADVDEDMCRAHICWGNYPGTHHCDIDLGKIISRIMEVPARAISIESSNHRHAHEWEVFKDITFPDDKILMPGVIDTTSNTIEHPDLVAQRILAFARILGPDRVIASTDCGFASTASATSVSGEVAWLKLKSLVQGAEIAGIKL